MQIINTNHIILGDKKLKTQQRAKNQKMKYINLV